MALSRTSRWEGGRLQVTSGTAVPAFPENEFWVYDHVDDRAQYLFIRRPDGTFQLGLPGDLLPPELRNGFANSTERTHTLLVVLEEMYRQRSLLKRSVLPEDIAEACYFFAAEASAKSTGNILNVDAGNVQSFTR